MKTWLLTTLYRVAEINTSSDKSCTTVNIASQLGLSQQTVSRHLIELESQGLIRREKSTRGTTLRITDKGVSELHKMYLTLHRILEKPKRQLTLEGEVFTGLGEGAYYVGQQGFTSSFQKKMRFKPFAGTLNLRLKSKHFKDRSFLESIGYVEIEGFRSGARSFGPSKCYPGMINGEVEGCAVIPLRTHYGQDVIEILAPVNLRKKLKLKDGDIVRISFDG